jgi:hypothetical protein
VLDGRLQFPLSLAPYESTFVILPRLGSSAIASGTGRSPSEVGAVLDISESWDVSFGESGVRGHWEQLRSWIDVPEIRHFSGVACYEKTLHLPDAWFEAGSSIRLELGEGEPVEPFVAAPHSIAALLDAPVREAAVVEVNGRKAGVFWCSPYLVDLTAWLRPGRNDLRLTVANLAMNHLAGRPARDLSALYARYGERFRPEDAGKVAPIKAGIFGPIRLCCRRGNDWLPLFENAKRCSAGWFSRELRVTARATRACACRAG